MKKIIIVLLLLASKTAFSQRNDIKINPLILPIRAWNVTYQHKHISQKWAIQVTSVLFDNGKFVNSHMRGFQITVDYKRYFDKSSSYVAPYYRYQDIIYESSVGAIQHTHPGFGLIVGKEVHPFKVQNWVVDFYFGVNYISEDYRVIEGVPLFINIPDPIYGVFIRAGITSGVRF